MFSKPISRAQMRKIYASARQAGLDDDLLHAFVLGLTGKEHISDLCEGEAQAVIEALDPTLRERDEPWTQVRGPSGRMVAVPLITRRQAWKIRQLRDQLGWSDKRLAGFCRKYAHVDRPEWLTRTQAGKIIEGLKKILERGGDKGGGEERGTGPA